MASGTKRKASDHGNSAPSNKRRASSSPNVDDKRTLVCAVEGLNGRVCIIPISVDAPVHRLKELIHQQNAPQLAGITASTMDVYSTKYPRHGWARVSDNGSMISRGGSRAKSILLPTKRIRDYFPSDTPPFHSGVVHVVAKVITDDLAAPQVGAAEPMPPPGDNDEVSSDEEDSEAENERYERVREELGLMLSWGIPVADFSQRHEFQGFQWLQYQRYLDVAPSRVFIGDKTTWRELYVACNQVIELNEGHVMFRCVEGFTKSKDGSTLMLWVGT